MLELITNTLDFVHAVVHEIRLAVAAGAKVRAPNAVAWLDAHAPRCWAMQRRHNTSSIRSIP